MRAGRGGWPFTSRTAGNADGRRPRSAPHVRSRFAPLRRRPRAAPGRPRTVNVLFTSIELTGLLLVIVVGLAAIADGGAGIDAGRALDFKQGGSVALAIMGGAGRAFFALIGFEDSVNLAEEANHPERDFPSRSSAAC